MGLSPYLYAQRDTVAARTADYSDRNDISALKPFSLTVRLVANMTVGHIMLKIIAGLSLLLKCSALFLCCLTVPLSL